MDMSGVNRKRRRKNALTSCLFHYWLSSYAVPMCMKTKQLTLYTCIERKRKEKEKENRTSEGLQHTYNHKGLLGTSKTRKLISYIH